MTSPTTAAVLTAAGSGSRLGLGVPKGLVPLAGVPLVVHALRGLARSGVVGQVVVTAPADQVDDVRAALADTAVLEGVAVTVVAGGASRQASVAAGLAAVDPGADVVLVHDAARALAPPELVARVVAAVRAGHPAVIPGLDVADTITRVGADPDPDGGRRADGTLDRTLLRAVQTPQGFERGLLDRAHAAGADRARDERTAATDDASLVEALGVPVWVVPGHEDAAKITTARDLAVAELVLAARVAGEPVPR